MRTIARNGVGKDSKPWGDKKETNRLIGFDRVGPPYPPPQAECISVDVTDIELISRAEDTPSHCHLGPHATLACSIEDEPSGHRILHGYPH